MVRLQDTNIARNDNENRHKIAESHLKESYANYARRAQLRVRRPLMHEIICSHIIT